MQRKLTIVLAVIALAGCGDGPDVEPAEQQRPHFGFNEDWASKPELFAEAAEAGADTVRFNLSWPVVEGNQGEYDWSSFDSLYGEALALGLHPILILADSPCWAYGEGPGCVTVPAHPPDPSHTADYARFAALVAERYPEARGIEIWNEPNLNKFWVGEPPNPEHYAELLAAAYDAIKRSNSDMPVIAAGLLPAGESTEEKIAYSEFLTRMLAAGGAGHFDALAVHPYPFFADDPVKRVGGVLTGTREALAAAGEERVPLWVTEVGISTSGPDPYTPEDQAEALVAIYQYLGSQPDVPVIIFHRFIDVEVPGDEREAGWGVISTEEERKPVFCALSELRGRSAC